ncbi:glutamate ABC transporter substrate-binding protein [Winogradskya humida]|uniref:Glutamine-binding protein GlnH n=1 Tax=Winogradskya humida TaxID=113566 RepID=A0ABQ3ZV25_9ACTN|nr:glutamate ABC transporter substrate-binding protein [Actinoplanes humidus]GIE22298.1 putative glutamine-binding protein GlnH [Actinoplanes humidus]
MRSRLPAVIVALTLLAVAGCSGDSDNSATRVRASTAPSAGADGGGAKKPADTSCNPRASLRPQGALPAPGNMPAGTFMKTIQDRGYLTLGTSQDTLLFSSRNPFSGTIEGFDVDQGRQIAQAIFGNPDKIKIQVIPYEGRSDLVSAKDSKIDLVADTMTATCERWVDTDFSTVYYDAGQRVLVSSTSTVKGIADLGGKKVCAASGSTSLDNIKLATSHPVAVGKPTFGDCLVAFQRNQVDAISTDDTILAGLAAQDPYAKVVGAPMSKEPYAMAISQDHKEFTRFVNAVLEKNRANGTWKKTYEHWLGDFGDAPKPPAAVYKD